MYVSRPAQSRLNFQTMARRTKQDAQATREHLLDTAELVFRDRGVSRTSLAEIAAAAGVTRGAIYWHFTDKSDLFNAMMNRVSLPMEEALGRAGDPSLADPLQQLRDNLLDVLRKTATDPQVRRVFEIATQKVEYVDELSGVRQRHLDVRNACLAHLARGLALARARGQIRAGLAPRDVAIGLHAMVDGLVYNWILDPAGFDLLLVGTQVVDAYLGGLAPAAASARHAANGDAAPGDGS